MVKIKEVKINDVMIPETTSVKGEIEKSLLDLSLIPITQSKRDEILFLRNKLQDFIKFYGLDYLFNLNYNKTNYEFHCMTEFLNLFAAIDRLLEEIDRYMNKPIEIKNKKLSQIMKKFTGETNENQ